jgi:hypothetical protein
VGRLVSTQTLRDSPAGSRDSHCQCRLSRRTNSSMPRFAYSTATISETILDVIRTGECPWCHDQRRPCRLPSVASLVAPPFGPLHVPGALFPDDEHGSMAEVTSSSSSKSVASTPAELAGAGGQ